MAEQQTAAPTRRADAERNRAKILGAARAAFADPDAEVSMAEIARRAGVAMPTLYRNFPGRRRELLEALFNDEVDDICAAADNGGRASGAVGDDASGSDASGEVLTAWLRRFFGFATTKHNVAADLLAHSDRSNPVFGESRARVLAAGRPLLDAAQRSHEIRADLTLEQILDLLIAVGTIQGGAAGGDDAGAAGDSSDTTDAGYLEPILQAALDGLRPRETR
jgi:AcrR family transcriptional regulator